LPQVAAGAPGIPEHLPEVAAMMKRLPTLQKLPDARQRVNTFIGLSAVPGGGNLASVRGTLYPRNTWVGDCGLTRGPEFFNDGFVYVGFNQPSDVFTTQPVAIKGDNFTAYLEPRVTGQVDGASLYDDRMFVFTARGVSPWTYVTVDEYLGLKRREAVAAVESARVSLGDVEQARFDRARADRTVAALQQTDPKAAAEMKAVFDETERQMEETRVAALADARQAVEQAEHEAADVERFASQLSGQELQAPVRLGTGPYGMAPAGQEGRGKAVKLNPALTAPDTQRQRVFLMVVSYTANNQKYVPDLRQALREMDVAALRRMVP
jgi:hypothetical protein